MVAYSTCNNLASTRDFVFKRFVGVCVYEKIFVIFNRKNKANEQNIMPLLALSIHCEFDKSCLA